MPWLACKSRRIHYELTGPEDGPACVLVNGLSQYVKVWMPFRDGLVARGFCVASYDMLGQGQSASPVAPEAAVRLVNGPHLCQYRLSCLAHYACVRVDAAASFARRISSSTSAIGPSRQPRLRY